LTGGLGADTFKLSYSKFTNTIKDYDPLTDRIEINRSNFGLSNIGSNWSLVQTTSSPNTVAFNNLLAMENRAAFIYNTQTGNLYLNQNATIGYMGSIFARTGNGLLVASFANKPNISATNLNLI
jgi:Ca2+-binding RTX toxin-like protein